jgi:hypothetical protein
MTRALGVGRTLAAAPRGSAAHRLPPAPSRAFAERTGAPTHYAQGFVSLRLPVPAFLGLMDQRRARWEEVGRDEAQPDDGGSRTDDGILD